MLSMNISRKFPNLATLNSFLSDTIFMELQILESVFWLFDNVISNEFLQTYFLSVFQVFQVSERLLKALLSVGWTSDLLSFLEIASG